MLSWYHIYFLKRGRAHTGLGWLGACGMLKYTFPWPMWSRNRKLLKGFSGKYIVLGPWRMHFLVSLQFFSLIKKKKALAHSSPNRWMLVINNEKNWMLGKWHAIFPWYKPFLITDAPSFSSDKGSFLKGICNVDKAERDFLSSWLAPRC